MELYEINDIREQNEFKGITFSEFKKTDVKKVLIENIYYNKIEQSCYWSGEMICAGHYNDLWEIILLFYAKYIHIANPKLIIYLNKRIDFFNQLIANGYIGQELRLRNNAKMRKLFCEIICILCQSKKKNPVIEMNIKKEDFDLTCMTERFTAPNISYIEHLFQQQDSKELFIAANELAYNIRENVKNIMNATYWLEWILEFDIICKQKNEKCMCERRLFAKVDSKFQMDIVWLIWDIFLFESTLRDELIKKIVQSSLNVFCFKYKQSCYKKRKMILYYVIELFTELYNIHEDMFGDKNKIHFISNNINNIYNQIKKNEHSPNTDYLYQNVKNTNLQNTIDKLETINNLGNEFIPRIDS